MNRLENARLREALESAVWTREDIMDFLRYVESGDERYLPKQREKQ